MLSWVRKHQLSLLSFIACAYYIAQTHPVQAADQLRIEDRWPEIFQPLSTPVLSDLRKSGQAGCLSPQRMSGDCRSAAHR
jgi:hypothetical protein